MKSGPITFTRKHTGRCYIGAPPDKMEAILDLAREFLGQPFVDSTPQEMKAVAEELLRHSVSEEKRSKFMPNIGGAHYFPDPPFSTNH